jgi:hypothetical protein
LRQISTNRKQETQLHTCNMAEVDEVTDSGAQEAYDEQDEAFAAQDGEDDAQNGEQEVEADAAEGGYDDAAQDAQDDRSGSPPPSESAR